MRLLETRDFALVFDFCTIVQLFDACWNIQHSCMLGENGYR